MDEVEEGAMCNQDKEYSRLREEQEQSSEARRRVWLQSKGGRER